MSLKLRKFLLVCVNYHNDLETVNYVKQVLANTYNLNMFVVVVDNSTPADKSGSLSKLSHDYNNVSVVQLDLNAGYLGGAEKGLSVYLENNEHPDWIIVSNTDLEFHKKCFFEDLNKLYEKMSGVGVVAPKIISKLSGKDQNPYIKYRPKKHTMKLYKYVYGSGILFSLFLVTSFFKNFVRKTMGRGRRDNFYKQYIYAPHGSFLIFNKMYFEKGGDLRYPVFLFGEEVFVAETCRNLGLRIIHEERIEITHKEHSTTGNSRKNRKYHAEAAKYCADTFFN